MRKMLARGRLKIIIIIIIPMAVPPSSGCPPGRRLHGSRCSPLAGRTDPPRADRPRSARQEVR